MVLKRNPFLPRNVVITSAARTPIGSFMGALSNFSPQALGGFVISHAIKRSRLDPTEVDEVIVGHVLQAGHGQLPARQAALKAGIPNNVDVFSVNKACASGLKSVMLAAQSIALNSSINIVVASGLESMSNAPFLLSKARAGGYKLGNGSLIDCIIHDGLWDSVYNVHMGSCVETVVKKMAISRVQQDQYTIESYRRATEGWKSGIISREVVPIHVTADQSLNRSPYLFERDEEYEKLKIDKISGSKAAFVTDGTITASNSSKISDGAAAVVLMSETRANQLNLENCYRILAFADVAVDSADFAIAPYLALKKSIELAGTEKSDINFFEINEAFSAVAIANMNLLDVDHSIVNVLGGAVSLGHPLGMSGTRILMSLVSVLESRDAKLGAVGICNGGGGASAMVVERVS